MVGWHHWLDGHEFEQTPGDREGQGSLVCCSPWGHEESDMTEWITTERKAYVSLGALCNKVHSKHAFINLETRHPQINELIEELPHLKSPTFTIKLKISDTIDLSKKFMFFPLNVQKTHLAKPIFASIAFDSPLPSFGAHWSGTEQKPHPAQASPTSSRLQLPSSPPHST